MGKQRAYDEEYKIQAVKLAHEIGSAKAANELGLPANTLYGWMRAQRQGRLDLGVGTQKPQTAMSLAEEVNALRQQVKSLMKLSILVDNFKICAEIYSKHKRALDLIYDNKPDRALDVAEYFRNWGIKKTKDGDIEFSMFSSDCGFTPKACVAYRPETKGKVEVTAKLVNRLKVYSGDITCFDDIRKIAAELNEQINSEKCQATDKPPFELLKFEKPYLIQTDLNILSGYFKETVTRKVSVESLITYEGRKYSVPPKYIGKYVEIEDDGTGFNITFNGHFIRHWDKTSKLTNFNHHDYMEIAR